MAESDHLSAADVAAYLSRVLDRAARERIEAHLDVCPECREEVVEVSAIAEVRTAPQSRSRQRRLWRAWAPVAIAAGLGAILVVRQEATLPSPATERPIAGPSEAMPRIEVVSPMAGDTVSARGAVFTWRGRAADAYRLTLLTESGAPLWTTETPDTSAPLPAEVLLEAGRRYFWRVDAIADGIAATTGAQLIVVPR